MKTQAKLTAEDAYTISDGRVMARDHVGLTPNGNPLAGRWALRDAAGTLIDYDKYRYDLAERHNIELHQSEDAHPVKLTKRQGDVVAYLQGKSWTPPTEIGREVWGKGHHSASASPVCKKLVMLGILKRNEDGHYSLVSLKGK